MAEPGALIGFAGPRVIEQTIRQKLPAGFQTAEFLLQHRHDRLVVPRRELRATVWPACCACSTQQAGAGALRPALTTVVVPVQEPTPRESR